jgi:hypothetical protein
VIAVLAATALAQNTDTEGTSEFMPPAWSLTDCEPRVIAGTVPYGVGRQAIETNANAYGAVALAENTLLAGDGKFIGVTGHALYNVARLPAIAACPTDLNYGTMGLDVYASAGGLMIPFEALDGKLVGRVFYAGSVSGSLVQFPSDKYLYNRIFSTEFYGAGSILTAYAAPLAPLLTRNDGIQTMVGDFVIGAEIGLPDHPDVAALRLGYVYSQGLYSNLNSKRTFLFATALLTDRFALLALARAGLERVPIQDMVGKTSLFGRNQVIKGTPASEPATEANAATFGKIDLTTLHFAQDDIGGGYVGVSAALAVRPRVFLHEASLTLNLFPMDLDLGEPIRAIRLHAGVEELPAMPWYAVDGGLQPYFDLTVFDSVHIRRNSPETLLLFPYAQGATEVSFIIQFGPGRELNDMPGSGEDG